MKRFASVLTILTSLAAPVVATADNLPIVDRSIELHGGDLYEHSTISFTIVSKSGAFDAEVLQDGGTFRYAVISDTDQGRRTVVSTNDGVQVLLDGEPQEVPADRAQRFRDFVSARVYFPLLPYRLDDPSVHQEDLGLETWPGADGPRGLHKVKVTFEGGSSTDAQDEYLYWFDPETGGSSSSPTASAVACVSVRRSTTGGWAACCSRIRRTSPSTGRRGTRRCRSTPSLPGSSTSAWSTCRRCAWKTWRWSRWRTDLPAAASPRAVQRPPEWFRDHRCSTGYPRGPARRRREPARLGSSKIKNLVVDCRP